MSVPRVLLSVLHWNLVDRTARCLASLRRLRGEPVQRLVVDNGSCEDVRALLAAEFPEVDWIRLPHNRGFAGGHAVALEEAQRRGADALLLLNSDAELEADTLAHLLAAWRQHGDGLYAAAPLRVDARQGLRLDYPSRLLPPDARPDPWRRDQPLPYDPHWRQAAPQRVGAAIGTALLLPLSVVAQHGWMDSDWFMYCEEIDYALRLRERGVASWLVPQARVHHAGSASTAAHPAVADCLAYYHARNQIRWARRHGGLVTGLLFAAKKSLRALACLPRAPRRAGLIARGVWDALCDRRGVGPSPDDAYRRPPRWPRGPRLERLRRKLVRLRADRGALCRLPIGGGGLLQASRQRPELAAWQARVRELLAGALARRPAPPWLWLDAGEAIAADPAARRVALQWEHVLVRPGGRDSAGAPASGVPLPDGGGHYLARLVDAPRLASADLLIDYSAVNLRVLADCPFWNGRLPPRVAVAPLVYPPDFGRDGRDIPLLSLFAAPGQGRRADFLAAARAAGLPLRNRRGVFHPDNLRALYRRCRILVNVHQTADHHTFEELRVLPALLCGVLVVSEEVPLREAIPYARFVIWSAPERLLDTVCAVHADYAAHWARVFTDPGLPTVLRHLDAADRAGVAAAVGQLSAAPPDRKPPTAPQSATSR
jgi:GT2 family glycosyltransferase